MEKINQEINEDISKATLEYLKTPVLLYYPKAIEYQYRLIKDLIPNIDIYYAVKSNTNAHILQTLYNLGCNFDIASSGEYLLLKECLLHTKLSEINKRVIYTHPIKSPYEFDFFKMHLDPGSCFFFDNEEELKKTKTLVDPKLVLRIKIPNSKCQVNLGYKFGCCAKNALDLFKKAPSNAIPYGLAFHVGSQTYEPDIYLKAFKTIHKLITILKKENINIKMVDIGGGFPIPYQQPVPKFNQIAVIVNSFIEEHPDLKVICEPGRFISASAMKLVVSIIGKTIKNNRIWYYIDDSIYNTFSGIPFDQCKYQIMPYCTKNDPSKIEICKPVVLAGNTCDSHDIISKDIKLPQDLKVGDKLIAFNMGAYTTASASNFNCFNKASIYNTWL